MPSRLSDRLLATGLVPLAGVRAAVARQAVYGGALDTALLELDAIAEGTLWGELAAATELGIPDRTLCESPQKLVKPDGSDALDLDADWSARCRAVPVGLKEGTVQILCGEPVARAEIEAATRALDIPFSLFVAPEIWIAAVQQAIYGRPMEPRLVRLFARVVGAEPVRRWQAAHTPAPPPTPPEPPIEIPAARLPPPVSETRPAEPVPAPAPAPAAIPAPASEPPQAPPVPSPPESPHDKRDVPGLIERLEEGDDVEAAHAKLVAITKQDFGPKPKRWAAWWKQGRRRTIGSHWAVRGALPQDRRASARRAEQELCALTGEYFGYAFDSPRRRLPPRERAPRFRWQSWRDRAPVNGPPGRALRTTEAYGRSGGPGRPGGALLGRAWEPTQGSQAC